MLKEYGFIRVGAVCNEIEIANVDYNVEKIINCLDKAREKGIEILTFPELSLSGATCYDLFLNDDLISSVLKGLEKLKKVSVNYDLVFIVGAPIRNDNALYNTLDLSSFNKL